MLRVEVEDLNSNRYDDTVEELMDVIFLFILGSINASSSEQLFVLRFG